MKSIFKSMFTLSLVTIMIAGCEDDTKKEETIVAPEPVSKSFSEEFEDCSALAGKGWVIINNSDPIGQMGWRQGKFEVRYDSKNGQITDGFPAYSPQKSQNDFVSCDVNAASGVSTISAWLVTPSKPMKNGDQIVFYTRTHGDYADRLQVRGNFTTDAVNVGKTATDVGDFTSLLLDINPSLTATGYPIAWTKYTITLSGLPSTLVNGRIAFRYFVPNGGPSGANSDMIGIDAFEFISK